MPTPDHAQDGQAARRVPNLKAIYAKLKEHKAFLRRMTKERKADAKILKLILRELKREGRT